MQFVGSHTAFDSPVDARVWSCQGWIVPWEQSPGYPSTGGRPPYVLNTLVLCPQRITFRHLKGFPCLVTENYRRGSALDPGTRPARRAERSFDLSFSSCHPRLAHSIHHHPCLSFWPPLVTTRILRSPKKSLSLVPREYSLAERECLELLSKGVFSRRSE